jgi:hypothetical protein
LGGLLAGVLIKFGPADAPRVSNRPAWFQFLTGLFTLSVAAILFWLHRSGAITEWWVLIIGSVILIPELLYYDLIAAAVKCVCWHGSATLQLIAASMHRNLFIAYLTLTLNQ